MHKRLILLALAVGLCFGAATRAANIILVNETYDTDGNGAQDDLGLEDFLKGLGHQVDIRRGNWTALDAAKIAELNAADLIVISRSIGSGNYDDDATEIANWNNLTSPMILLTPYLSRGTSSGYRWYWINSTTVNNLVGPRMQVVETAHPIFKGVPLDASGQVDVVDGTTGTGQTSFAGTIDVGSGKLLAKTATGTNAWIVEWQPGTPYYTGSPGTPGDKRLLFSCGTQESGATPQGAFNLTENGKKLLVNAINYMMGISERKTSDLPIPENEATDVVRDVVLSWTPSGFAATHDVYFGVDADAVANANRTNPRGVLASQGQAASSYDPAGLLEFGRTYYWRIDDVNGAPDFTINKGEVWSFTAEPFSYPIANVTATASSFTPGMGPENVVNRSGLNDDDQHSDDAMAMWVSADKGPQPTWIQFEFDQLYELDRLLVWNSNQALESLLGFGAKDVAISYSADGETWTQLGDFEFAQAPGDNTYTTDTAVDFAGAAARFVKLTIASNWGGLFTQYGLAEVRFLYIPVQPREPQPANGATGVDVDTVLTWRAGREAASHKVYFAADRQVVADGTGAAKTVADNEFQPSDLGLGMTFYWKVDEVNEAATHSVWSGDVWSFTTREYLVADDMESYTDDEGSRVYETWIDGLTDDSSGSVVGHMEAPFAERTIVHGGKQSMPYEYNNIDTPFYSEAERQFSPAQDWTLNGADTLSLWVRGNRAAYVNDGGSISMSAGGHDIWDNADDFRYAHRTLTGNGTVIVKVESVENTNAWAKAGVMIRQSLDADSKFVYFIVSYSSGVSMGWRPIVGGTCSSATQASVAAPQWVKLTRAGDVFTAQYSADGKVWTDLKNADGTVASTTLAMTNPVYVGLCVTSHNAAMITTAKMSEAAVTGTVSGDWQVATIGDDPQPANSPDPMYVTLQDSAGKTATVTNPSLATQDAWTQWKIPLTEFAGVNIRAVKKMYIGVGSKTSPVKGGTGMLYIDDIGFGSPAQ